VQVERPAVRATSETDVLGWSAQGWNVDDVPSGDRRRFSTARNELGTSGVGGAMACTLLGPEGSAGEPGIPQGPRAGSRVLRLPDGAPTVL
jgi:hypothetical protein